MSSTYTISNDEEEKKPFLTRRELLLAAVVGLLSLPAAARFLTVLGSFVSVPERIFTGAVIPNWVPAGLVKDLTETPRSINFGEDIVYVLKAKNGDVLAYSGVCPHAGCLVSYEEKKKLFVCPCHGGHFDLTGKVTAGPPPRGLFNHNVKVSLGRVMVGRRKDG